MVVGSAVEGRCGAHIFQIVPDRIGHGGSDDAPEKTGGGGEGRGTAAPPAPPEVEALGRLALLRAVLRRAAEGGAAGSAAREGEAIERGLAVCEDLLFRTLPLCQPYLTDAAAGGDGNVNGASLGPQVLHDVLLHVSDLTLRSEAREVRSEATASAGAGRGGPPPALPPLSRTQTMLLRWLVPSDADAPQPVRQRQRQRPPSPSPPPLLLPPMGREMAVAAAHLHLLRLAGLGGGLQGEGSPSPSHWQASSRRMVAGVCQLLIDPRTGEEGRQSAAALLLRLLTNGSPLRAVAVSCFRGALAELRTSSLGRPRRGRKRMRSEGPVGRTIFYLARNWSPPDVASVGSVLREVSLCKDQNSAERQDLSRLVGKLDPSSTCKRPGSTVLVMYYLSGCVDRGEEPVDIDLDKAHSKAVYIIVDLLKDAESCGHSAVPALAHFVEAFMVKRRQAYPSRHLMRLFTSFSGVVQIPGEGTPTRHSPSVLLSIAAVLSEVGVAVPPDCPSDVMKLISSTFQGLFQSKEWPLFAATMTALEMFVSTIHSNHQSVLPHCLTPASKPLLQSRLNGSVYDLHGKTTSGWQMPQRAIWFQQMSAQSRRRRRRMHGRADWTIETSSTAWSLSRDGEVGAIVIFPHGSCISPSAALLSRNEDSKFAVKKLGLVTRISADTGGTECGLQID